MTKSKIRESDVEEYLVKRVAECGGIAEKFVSPNRASVPDRIVLWTNPADFHFVECKAPGKKPTAAQMRDHERRRAMGHIVVVVDSFETVDDYIQVYR